MTPGPYQIILIILLIMLLFGAKRIPGIMENLAKGITSFKKGLKEEDGQGDTPRSLDDKTESKDE